jgi:general secretion pathway protein I
MITAAQDLHPNTSPKGVETGAPGFSVLEAIIAIAILAIAFLPLLGLQTQMTRTTLALERNTQLMEAKRSALAYIQALNPMRDPQGNLDLGHAQMHWNAVQISQERPAMKMGGTKGRFMVALYDVEVTLTFDTQRTQNFSVHATGWRSRWDFLSDL